MPRDPVIPDRDGPRRRGSRVAQLVALLLIAVGVVLALAAPWSDEPDRVERPPTITHESKTGPLKAPAPAVEAAKDGTHDGLGHETQTPRDDLANDRKASPRAPRIVGPVPLASANQPGCTTRQNNHNYSFRNGVRPSLGVFHLTVAPNLPGWGDINGVAIFLDRPATQASSHYIIDNEGHCLYTVPEAFKAWTQANFNPATACAFEVQNTGSERSYAGTAGLDKLARVARDCGKRWGIPLRRAQVSGSRVVRSGFIDHIHLGAAGGNHSDIRRFGASCLNAGPTPDTWRCVDLILERARAGVVRPPTKTDRVTCRKLNSYRLRVLERRKAKLPPPSTESRHDAERRKAALAKRKVGCSRERGAFRLAS